jgi:anaerobic magnesium-protoporphyrin IX monomethyl ester cyclase
VKSLRILLVNPIPKGALKTPFPVLPLGIACNAAIAKTQNADVKVLWGQDLESSLDQLLLSWTPDCAGFQTFVNTISLSHRLADKIRSAAPKSFIIFGGVQASNNPEGALGHSSVNAVISGEGELMFKFLLERFFDDPYGTPGLIYRDFSGQIKTNSGKCLYENLDDLPEIPYELFYRKSGVPVGHILTHRGCPFHCSHCPLRFRAGVPIRSHSADRIIKTVQRLQNCFGIRHIDFFDENFTMDSNHVLDICHGIADCPVTFSCTARISQVSLELCREMADAGCTQITFGLGTGVSRLQTILGTNENLDHARDLIAGLTNTKIEPLAVFSLGLPTETRAEMNQTVKYALSLPRCKIRFEPAAPLPGSPLHKTAESGGRFLIRSWDDYVRPGQVVYLPAGWSKAAFYSALYRAKLAARIKSA